MKMRGLALATTGVAVALAALAASHPASAGTITITSTGPTSLANAQAAEAAFLAGFNTVATETFDDEATGIAQSITTTAPPAPNGIGTFSSQQGGQLGQLVAILDAATSPFSGRFDVTSGPGSSGNWLDSYDSEVVEYAVNSPLNPFTGIGFFMTDVLDVAGSLFVVFEDGESATEQFNFSGSGGTNPDGTVQYVQATFDAPIVSLTFTAAADNDGFGIDDVSFGQVPEPATLALLGAGLVGIGAAARRRRSA